MSSSATAEPPVKTTNGVPPWNPLVQLTLANPGAAVEAWLFHVAGAEALFRTHVYDNPAATPTDYAQLRLGLYWLLWNGQGLVLSLRITHSSEGMIERIEGEMGKLMKMLIDWRGMEDDSTDEYFETLVVANAKRTRKFYAEHPEAMQAMLEDVE